ncbi:phosphoesterase [Bacillus sp. FJAT-27225]|uniref:phosphatase PAP2 family protein n=1 Tax=Bacillus sp. FJAT-27225 TaxID=1743144 RepID=UPI00080C2A86|nr:phosphatase PAP2 family protein [Bacillus sp. FJAT-27225]OCA83236.1 phosphoesterase [Bacillus sp. FJAT-27225]
MTKFFQTCYDFECQLFYSINRHFENKALNKWIQLITHFGGASFTIGTVLFLLFFTTGQATTAAIASAWALFLSHLPVFLIKKLFPRRRPYLALERALIPENPLKDHSFPSGHTTAIFSVVTPLSIQFPILSFALVPLASLVGLSRIFLGLHYPSDVLAGALLGLSTGAICLYLL